LFSGEISFTAGKEKQSALEMVMGCRWRWLYSL